MVANKEIVRGLVLESYIYIYIYADCCPILVFLTHIKLVLLLPTSGKLLACCPMLCTCSLASAGNLSSSPCGLPQMGINGLFHLLGSLLTRLSMLFRTRLLLSFRIMLVIIVMEADLEVVLPGLPPQPSSDCSANLTEAKPLPLRLLPPAAVGPVPGFMRLIPPVIVRLAQIARLKTRMNYMNSGHALRCLMPQISTLSILISISLML